MAEEAVKIDREIESALMELPPQTQPVARHILASGGKRIRPLLTVLFARLQGYEGEEIYRLAASMEFLHAATLLHDDILDNASKRRGQPAAHTLFGVAKTILAGDALLAYGNAIVASFGKPDLLECYASATVETASGEILEIDMLGNPEWSESVYNTMVAGKTAALIGQACRMGARFGGASKTEAQSALAYGTQLGLAFQLVDDVLDFAPETQTGKPAGGDVREGKMTPPLRIYRQNLSDSERKEFDRSFRSGVFSDAEIEDICSAVCKLAPEALKQADSCLEKARLALTLVPGGKEKGLLNEMVTYVRGRRK